MGFVIFQAITLSLKEAEQKGPEEKNLRNSFGACSRSGRQEEKKGRKGVRVRIGGLILLYEVTYPFIT